MGQCVKKELFFSGAGQTCKGLFNAHERLSKPSNTPTPKPALSYNAPTRRLQGRLDRVQEAFGEMVRTMDLFFLEFFRFFGCQLCILILLGKELKGG